MTIGGPIASNVKWHKTTVRAAGQYYQVPLLSKYGRNEGAPTLDRFFCVSLILGSSAKSTKTFRVHGVADVSKGFDRSDNKVPELVERPRWLEQALVSPFSLLMEEGDKEAS